MRGLRYAIVLALPILATVLVGCKPGEQNHSTAPAAAAPIAVNVQEVDYAALDAAVKERKGKVVLVDFWATWCGPCVKKFPHFVELHKKYADKGLACMSISLDPEGPAGQYNKENVLSFLKEKDATFPNFIVSNYRKDNKQIENRFGLQGGIPFMAMFDKTGKRVWTSEDEVMEDKSDKQRDEYLEKLIQKELAK